MSVPTAKEILELHYNMDRDEDGHPVYYNWSAEDATIAFAKLHVEAALKEASEKADTDGKHVYMFRREYVPVKVDKNSILNAYPLENIK